MPDVFLAEFPETLFTYGDECSLFSVNRGLGLKLALFVTVTLLCMILSLLLNNNKILNQKRMHPGPQHPCSFFFIFDEKFEVFVFLIFGFFSSYYPIL